MYYVIRITLLFLRIYYIYYSNDVYCNPTFEI